MEIRKYRRTRIESSRCCKDEMKENVVKNNVQIRSGIKSNTLRAGFKRLTPKATK